MFSKPLFPKVNFKGILLAVIIGAAACLIAPYTPLNSILLGLLAGILIGNLIKIPASFQSGISFTSSKLLEISLLFLAFGISFSNISKIGWLSFVYLIIVILIVLVFSIYLSKKLKFEDSTCYLIGFGTAICGSSAIAAVSSSVTKNKEDIGISLAVVNLLGAIGMIAIPPLLSLIEINTMKSGFIIGSSLHSVGNVAGAGYAVGDAVGQTSITIKLARVALLSPALIFYRYMINKDSVSDWREHFRLPWYIWGFIAISIFTSIVSLPAEFLKFADLTGKIILTIAMTAIGLKVGLRSLYLSGRKALLSGIVIFLLLLSLLGIAALLL